MRKLIVIAADQYVRNMVSSGAFDEILDGEAYFVAGAGVQDLGPLEATGNFLGRVSEPRRGARLYSRLQRMLLASLRRRSRTMAHKVELMPRRRRWAYVVAALPPIGPALRRLCLWRTGLNEDLHRIVEEVGPDVVIVPSGGIDPLLTDAVRSARALGIPSLVLVHNWDNLSSKGAFAVKPDRIGVWGPQSAEHAQRIHGFPAAAVRVLGAPSLDGYFRHEPGSTEPRFPFRYVLFAGCYAPFDELSPLQTLERTIAEERLDLKVVYRPHPHRRGRLRPDRFDERRFEHVVLDPELRDLYKRAFEDFEDDPGRKPRLPSLEAYPSLFEHAEFVICPLSTMIVEAAAFERQVLVIAYDDGIHPNSPAEVVRYEHFEGIDGIDGFSICRAREQLRPLFLALARDRRPPSRPLRNQIRWWLHFDERNTYAERLAVLVDEVVQLRSPTCHSLTRQS
jgi:hypothetical protein